MQLPDTVVDQRRSALRALAIFTVPIAALLLGLNLHLGANLLAVPNIGLLLVSLGLVLVVRKSLSLQPLALIYLCGVTFNIAVAVAEPNIQPGATSSIALIPVFAYLLLDTRLAMRITLGSLAVTVSAYFVGAGVAPYRLNPRLIGHVILPVVIVVVICHFYTRGRTRTLKEMVDNALRDSLTGLWDREKLTSVFELERQRARRMAAPLSLILIDLDQFKKLNDRYGHDAGDAALVFFARMLRQRLRATDLICRIGGEEFAVLLRDTNSAGALAVAEALRRALEESRFKYHGERLHMTLSAGIAQLGPDGDDWLPLYRAADARLYACKAEGRNCVLNRTVQAA